MNNTVEIRRNGRIQTQKGACVLSFFLHRKKILKKSNERLIFITMIMQFIAGKAIIGAKKYIRR